MLHKGQHADYYVQTYGNSNNPPLLMLAGLASDNRSWGPVTGLLGEHFHLIMPDNQGCGQTLTTTDCVHINGMIEDYAKLISHYTDDSISILGHSMGAMLAAQLAAHPRSKANRLILAAGAAQISAPMKHLMTDMAQLRQQMVAAGQSEDLWFRLLFQWLFAPQFFEDERAVKAAAQLSMVMPNGQSAENFTAQVNALVGLDIKAAMPNIPCETLLIRGALDRFAVGIEAANSFEMITNTQTIMLENAGHSLHWDQPNGFAQAVINFLSKA